MALTGINSEDHLVQSAFAAHLRDALGWETMYAFNAETFGPDGTLGRLNEREAVLVRDLRAALDRLNPELPPEVIEQAVSKVTRVDFSRSLLQHNHEFYGFIRNGVPVQWQESGVTRHGRARVIDFRDVTRNRFLAVRELKLQGVRVPHYNRRADLVCFVNGLPLVFIELKAVHRNIRAAFNDNLSDYLSEHSIAHAFHHNAFLVVSNGVEARYGSITSRWEHFVEWKRLDEKDKASLDALTLLNGMLNRERLLDLVENFVLYDNSRAGGLRKIVARNHQVLGVNRAVASVIRQEELKRQFPVDSRLIPYQALGTDLAMVAERPDHMFQADESHLPLVKRAHDDLGRLGVFWHTQGSGKSYSMAFFAEKVRRVVHGNFTFLVMTDREDLDDQIYRTFSGCGIISKTTPRADSGEDLKKLLGENHRFVFSLIHKFNQPVDEAYSSRDDIIVMSDEAHRTQAGKFARNMRRALPYAAFIGFTGTPLFTGDELTRRIFGNYVSRYDFRRSEEDQSTVRLVYENRGEKLGLARLDLNDKIAEAIEQAELDADQQALLERLLGKDYEVITADDRLDKIADDFVGHCSGRWQAGKSMFVCIDKITCARMHQRIQARWAATLSGLRASVIVSEAAVAVAGDDDARERLSADLDRLRARIAWMDSTIIEIIISEAQNEVRDFKKWDFDIIPHRHVMKTGFETADGKRVAVEDAFKDPEHPFRVAIVCAMWLTGFDVECLSTLYIDKPMKAHNLMQAIARANRVFPGKDCGVIVDYNGMLNGLRAALAMYALGDGEDEEDPQPGGGVVTPLHDLVGSLRDAIEAAESHLRTLGFEPTRLVGSKGFARLEAFRDAVECLYGSDEDKHRFEILARQVFLRFRTLIVEPSAGVYAERHDNIEGIYKRLQARRDNADVVDVLKALHRIVNEAIQAAAPGRDHAEGLTVNLSQIDFERLKREFQAKVGRKHTAVQDIRTLVEDKLAQMLATNPLRMDFYRKYQEIIADYNREKDRTTVEATFAALVDLVAGLDVEQKRAAQEGLTEDELVLFDLVQRTELSQADRERLKQASKDLLASLHMVIAAMPGWTQKAQTQSDVEVLIVNHLFTALPRPPYTDEEVDAAAGRVYDYVWHRSASGQDIGAANR